MRHWLRPCRYGRSASDLLAISAMTSGSRPPRRALHKVEIALSKQIATRIGSVREVVSRAIARLEDDGLLKVAGHRITIPDTDRLVRVYRTGLTLRLGVHGHRHRRRCIAELHEGHQSAFRMVQDVANGLSTNRAYLQSAPEAATALR